MRENVAHRIGSTVAAKLFAAGVSRAAHVDLGIVIGSPAARHFRAGTSRKRRRK